MTESKAREGLEHLQAAAVEVIAAMRTFLDIAEEVVRDPAQVAAAVQGLAETAKHAAAMAGAAAAAAAASGGSASAPTSGESGENGEGGDRDRVTRIRVS